MVGGKLRKLRSFASSHTSPETKCGSCAALGRLCVEAFTRHTALQAALRSDFLLLGAGVTPKERFLFCVTNVAASVAGTSICGATHHTAVTTTTTSLKAPSMSS